MSIKIWWDESVAAYRVTTPYNETFFNLLKQLIPFSDREWDKSSKTWTVTERFMEPIRQLAEKTFRDTATVITKAQSQKSSVPPALAKQPLDGVICQFFRLLAYEDAQAAYRKASMRLHPDRGGSMEQMTALNSAWTRLEKELFKKGVDNG